MKVSPTRFDEIFSWMVRIGFYGLKGIGLAPISLRTKVRVENSRSTYTSVVLFSKIGLFYNLLFSAFVVTAAVFEIRYMIFSPKKNPKNAPSTQTMYMLNRILSICSAWFIIVYWALKQKQAITIVNGLIKVHRLLCDLEGKLSNSKPFISLAVYVVTSVFMCIVDLISSTLHYRSFLALCLTSVTVFTGYWFLIEYSIILAVVMSEIESLNKILLNLQELPKYSFHKPSLSRHTVLNIITRGQLETLELLQSVSISLNDVVHDVNDFFSLPTLFTLGSLTFAFIKGIYYLILPFAVPMPRNSLLMWIRTGVFVLLIAYTLILLSFAVTETTNKAKLTGRIVNKLLARTRNKEMMEKLAQMSSQLLHEDFSFTAYGFFSLDFTLLQSILGATITYLVIIIQFTTSSIQSEDGVRTNSTLIH